VRSYDQLKLGKEISNRQISSTQFDIVKLMNTYDSMAKTIHAWTVVVSMKAHVQSVFGLQQLDAVLMIMRF